MNRRDFLSLGTLNHKNFWSLCLRAIKRLDLGELCDEVSGQSVRLKLSNIQRLPELVQIVKQGNLSIHIFSGQSMSLEQACPIIYLDIQDLMAAFNPHMDIKFIGENGCLAPTYAPLSFFQERGFEQFYGLEPSLSLLEWIAEPQYHDQRPYYLFTSGVQKLQILLADGSSTVVGDFGVDMNQSVPLAQLYEIIPQLFVCLHDAHIRSYLSSSKWPLNLYRLDALQKDISIARFFLGHQHTLMYPLRCVISKGETPKSAYLLNHGLVCEEQNSEENLFESTHIKGLFDESGVWSDK